MQPLEPDDPRELGEYRLLRRIGSGGMGRVYLARSGSGRTVAVKVVHPHIAVDDQFRRRFQREVESARRVGGDWTAPVLDADPDGPMPWVATGYVAGPSLSQAVEEYGPLPETTVRALGAVLAEALRHVHGLGLVHRDVKPSNVLLTVDGPRLIDFGIARASDATASLTSTGVSIGSPGYMSPEQVLGKGVDGSTDVFALGAVLAYAATGGAPFPGDSSAALLYRVVHEEPELDGLDGGLRETVARCLDKNAAGRPTPEEIADELAGSAGGAAGLVRTGWLPGPLVEQVSRRAVELLDLEPEARTGSGPVAFSGLSDGPGASGVPGAAGATGASGATGAAGAVRPGTGPAPGQPVPPVSPAGFGPPDPSYGGGSAAAYGGAVAPGEGGTGGTDAARGTKRRRRVSCTVVVSFACVVAAALLGTYFLGGLPGGGTTNDSAERPDPSASRSGGATDRPGDGGREKPERGTVPAAFIGTWEGALTTQRGVPGGTLTVTLKKGGKGDTIGTGKVVLSGLTCGGEWKLESVTGSGTGTKLRAESVATDDSPLCAPGGGIDEFILRPGGDLRYRSGDDAGGHAAGTLRKTG